MKPISVTGTGQWHITNTLTPRVGTSASYRLSRRMKDSDKSLVHFFCLSRVWRARFLSGTLTAAG